VIRVAQVRPIRVETRVKIKKIYQMKFVAKKYRKSFMYSLRTTVIIIFIRTNFLVKLLFV